MDILSYLLGKNSSSGGGDSGYNIKLNPDYNISNVYPNINNLLEEVGNLNTSNMTNTRSMFINANRLHKMPLIDTSNVTNMSSMFENCYELQDVPILNTSKVENMYNMFYNCGALTDKSLDNILQMCININPNYSKTKALTNLGFRANSYSVSRFEALPHYQEFLNAGWTIGY